MEIKEIIDSLKEVQVLSGPFEGGQKTVYKCLINGKYNALKFIKSVKCGDEESIRCEREISTLALCNSDYLIRLGEIPYTEVIEENEHIVYYSEEWIEGKSLYDLVKEGKKFTESDIRKIGVELSYAIEELWKFNKIHRDIKPLNIMYDTMKDRFVLLDLGMVFDSTNDTLTQYGYLPGTMGYYSPEQFDLARKNDLDFRSDLFCVGIVLYQLLCGKHPFMEKGDTQEEIFNKIKNVNPPRLENVSLELENVIFRLLRKRPSERFRSCGVFRNFMLKGE